MSTKQVFQAAQQTHRMSHITDKMEEMNINDQTMTTSLFGKPLADKTNSLTVGPRGPMLLQDVQYLEEMAHFDRERIPERVVHAKGGGAFGFLEITKPDITKYSKAKLFNTVGKKTPVAVRFSTVGGESGSADTVRDPRGFSVKMYTEEGNWDLVGNNTPIFFIRDPVLFTSFIHTQKRHPQSHLKMPDAHWDFFALRPELTHQMTFLFSDRGIPDGFRFMNGYGSHTFKLVNENNEAFYTKFHFKPQQGVKNLDVKTAARLAGENPEYSIEDLFNAIKNKNFPKWTLYIQIMTYEQAAKFKFNPFDVTKVWPHKEYPLIEVGVMTLNCNPSNYFAEIEQLAFCPANMVPGIEPSPDRMLQGRLFSYTDTQRYRLGVNYHQIPVNRARCPYMTPTMRDGAACVDGNLGGMPNYYPNSYTKVKKEDFLKEHVHNVSGDVNRFDFDPDDCFEQVTDFWTKVLKEDERQRLVENIANHMAAATPEVQTRAIANFDKVHPTFGDGIRAKLNLIKK